VRVRAARLHAHRRVPRGQCVLTFEAILSLVADAERLILPVMHFGPKWNHAASSGRRFYRVSGHLGGVVCLCDEWETMG
jgi:hypothetical protein